MKKDTNKKPSRTSHVMEYSFQEIITDDKGNRCEANLSPLGHVYADEYLQHPEEEIDLICKSLRLHGG